jgi:hypothetical protein
MIIEHLHKCDILKPGTHLYSGHENIPEVKENIKQDVRTLLKGRADEYFL